MSFHAHARMLIFITTSLVFLAPLGSALSIVQGNDDVPVGQLSRRQAKNFGVFTVDCQGREEPCNNACFYINCLAPGKEPNPDVITYHGDPSVKNIPSKTANRNRQQSGCAIGGTGKNPCHSFPFAQRWDPQDNLAKDVDCDEWPPACSIQRDFVDKALPNSLRCMDAGPNRSLGSVLGSYIKGPGGTGTNHPLRPVGAMSAGDFFKVSFDTTNANPAKVKYCLPNPSCVNDGWQFEMKFLKGTGRIQVPYHWTADSNSDNRYGLAGTAERTRGSLKQCSVEGTLTNGGDELRDITTAGPSNVDKPGKPKCDLTKTTTCKKVDNGQLPEELTLKRLPAQNIIEFEYASLGSPSYIKFTEKSKGRGTGPAKDPNDYCEIKDKPLKAGQTCADQSLKCWFPCYEK